MSIDFTANEMQRDYLILLSADKLIIVAWIHIFSIFLTAIDSSHLVELLAYLGTLVTTVVDNLILVLVAGACSATAASNSGH